MGSWTLTQRLSLVSGVLLLAHAIGGMIVNPDFATGSAVTRETWLWMDWNGWHALSGILLWGLGIIAAFRADWARLFGWLVIITQAPIVIWMLFDPRPLGLFFLPTTTDLVFHALVAVLFAFTLLADRGRPAPAAA